MTEIFHTYQLLKTEFIAQKDNIEQDGVSLELIQSTCLMNYPINRNNVLQGNNLIYVNGAYVTFYNFFQNNKQFASVVLPYQTVGMVGNNAGRDNVAIATQKQDKSQLYISVYTFSQELVPTYTIKKQLVLIDMIMIRTTHIILAVHNPKMQEYQIVIMNGKLSTTINCKYKIKRLINLDHKIYILFEEGGMFLMDVQKSLRFIERDDIHIDFPDKIIDDYFQVDNQTKVLLYNGGVLYCYWFQTQKQFVLDFRDQIQGSVCRMIKVGRNILVAHRNSLTISHFVIGEDTLTFVGHHTYHEKLKAGILSMQSSQDEMHAALAVQITEREQTKIQNFIFNLSSISKSFKFMSPFTRIMSMGADWGNFCCMENVLSSNAYLLIGSKIFNLLYSTTLQRKKMFNLYEVPKFMTVHPLGYQILCGFDNIIKFYNKVEKDMQQIWSQQYMCTAAKYSKSGGLVLCCIEDSYTTLIVYDCYNFKRIRNVPMPFLKLYTTKLEWVQNNSAIVLSTNSQVIKVNVFSGEKLSQFREKRQNYSIKCIDYDAYSDKVIGGTNSNNIILASKTEHSGYNLCINKMISFPEQVSHIKINYGLRTVFFGTKTGKLYWCNYPLKIKTTQNQQGHLTSTISQQMNVIKLHNSPITSIDHTNNNKFMLVNIKNQGYFQFKIRKMRGKDSNNVNMNMIFQQLGNPILNTIDTSSTLTFAANKQKLKIALEKRKQCFSDLEQFRRQWEIRLIITSKQIQNSSKKQQLNFINETLSKIEEIKVRKKKLQANIQKIDVELQEEKTNKQQSYIKQMLELYAEQEKQRGILQKKKKQYDEEYNKLVEQCNENLKQIEEDLSQKKEKFYHNYTQMLKNLQDFAKRIETEKREEEAKRKEQKIQKQQHLKSKQLHLSEQSNNLSMKITQNKKQFERYHNRKLFLQYKNKYFEDQNAKCLEEKGKLLELKQRLESQLKQLQVYTDKKEKKLKMYLQANETLRKYKEIHENLTQTALRQTQFIKSEKLKLDQNIVEVQKELSNMATSNQTAAQQIVALEQQIKVTKNKNYALSLRMKDISYYLNQIVNAMDNIGYCKDQSERSQKLKKIYEYYYVERSAQKMIEEQTKNELNYEKNLIEERNEKIKVQQSKILGELEDQKEYIVKNMDMYKNYNKRINQEINLNYLQIQAQNYNLIAECNLRKEQTANKKKILNQLMESVKQIHIYMDQMHKGNNSASKSFTQKTKKKVQSNNQVPFVVYEKAKKQQAQLVRMKSNEQILTSYSTNDYTHSRPGTCNNKFSKQNSRYQIKKMLDIKSVGNEKQNVRRIQTATHKDKKKLQTRQEDESIKIIKPLTATFKDRVQRSTLKSANIINRLKKSNSKASFAGISRIKYSVGGV